MDSELFVDFLINVLASVFVGTVAVVAAYVWGWLPKRAQSRWMGMSGKTPHLQIYASNLNIKRADPVEGEAVRTGFIGTAMNEREYISALKLRDSLRASRVFEGIADLFGRQVKQTDVKVCPRKWDEELVPRSNLVFLGSPIYNSGTKYYLDRQPLVDGKRRVEFVLEDAGRVLRVERQSYMRTSCAGGAPGEYEDDYGVIYRMNLRGISVFICAGLGTDGTCYAANHLATRWKEIKTECGEGGFICLLEKPAGKRKPNRPLYLYKEEREEYSQSEPEQSET